MCIRDSSYATKSPVDSTTTSIFNSFQGSLVVSFSEITFTCLLYTSDAADERSSVDLGGRRIIKKKNTKRNSACICITTPNNQLN